jgi:hypothetical protein
MTNQSLKFEKSFEILFDIKKNKYIKTVANIDVAATVSKCYDIFLKENIIKQEYVFFEYADNPLELSLLNDKKIYNDKNAGKAISNLLNKKEYEFFFDKYILDFSQEKNSPTKEFMDRISFKNMVLSKIPFDKHDPLHNNKKENFFYAYKKVLLNLKLEWIKDYIVKNISITNITISAGLSNEASVTPLLYNLDKIT